MKDTVDWGHEGGIEREIADSMQEGWEQKLAPYMKLTEEDLDDIRSNEDPELMRSELAIARDVGRGFFSVQTDLVLCPILLVLLNKQFLTAHVQ